jgi:hypothetical protein
MTVNRPAPRAAPAISNPLDILGSVLSLVNMTLSGLMQIIHGVHAAPAVGRFLHIIGIGMEAATGNPAAAQELTKAAGWGLSETEEVIGAPIVEGLFRGALGIDPDYGGGPLHLHNGEASWRKPNVHSQLHSDSSQGVRTIKRLIGFGVLLPLSFTALNSVLRMIGAQRIGDGIAHVGGKIGEEIGLPFAIGMSMSQILQTASARQIEELVNVQLQPNRLDMMTARQLARQHKITKEQFWAILDLQGYPDDLKELILQLDSQQLALTDLQALWVTGKISREEFVAYCQGLGFTDHDIDLLAIEYIDHAETVASTQYQTLVRTAFTQDRITAAQFSDMMAHLLLYPQSPPGIPPDGQPTYEGAPEQVRHQVDLMKAAIEFGKHFGRNQETTAQLKALYLSKHISHNEAVHRLQAMGYSQADARLVMDTWTIPSGTGKPALTTAKVLQYTKSDVFDTQTAYNKLVDLGMKPDDALFLASNPDPKVGPYYPPFSVATVIQAYKDGAATSQEAAAALARLHLTPDAIQQELEIAHWQMQHATTFLTSVKPQRFAGETPHEYQQALAGYTEYERLRSQIQTLFMAGALGDAETISLLEEIGMLQSDAGFTWAAWYTQAHGTPPHTPTPTGASTAHG